MFGQNFQIIKHKATHSMLATDCPA